MRNLVVVIEQIIALVPESREEFIYSLRNLQNSTQYTAPEAMWYKWKDGADILYQFIGEEPKEDWQHKIVDIWMDKK